jgi:hypothetical protein
MTDLPPNNYSGFKHNYPESGYVITPEVSVNPHLKLPVFEHFSNTL